ncbi:NADP-dependent malic enzyme [Acidocella aminolytica]|jgi:malate dehydrogenase (oxaloacetate-decarboxylating)(NADP+)|uniref:Malate dehydrogenase n=1 Tax=Acidocella aminolytica 101 = DSM 11237 TaxID=1120923 RepID=A0A0D6PJD1_9PROT|nr:NADP-dependent malic enzyme [Acidocella aminolytica]GAN81782.1 malate dehydrogenase [Acidocella aminolytica 101 = DSM 11237]GBQ37720.1 malic enzyme [Acidocella aminolytica 101 = DSM 11237]SHE51913.1 malate dehydrogenase (oxaloacetate-decarboxylating)(NADP+) [Acidocella aminolytica 101 = DSM 11237]
MDEGLRKAALEYHRSPRPGKLAIVATKRMETSRDLALAYSPGVAAACEAIKNDPDASFDLTSRANLVAVITNGTAVLGLGNIGALAGKPVMEGKSVLFKKFAGIDSFDIEVNEQDPDKFIETVARLEPSFGGINLEDIKAPECFKIEKILREKMNIPVFHDDQHGTAIIVGAAVLNTLVVLNKKIEEVKIVTSGAGAAALSCVNILKALGANPENITMTDKEGVVYKGRPNLDSTLVDVARETNARTLRDVLPGADIFLGLSAPRVLKEEWLPLFAQNPLILALANPEPEIMPDVVKRERPDAIMATGRSDFPNQVNNVLCFPFIFRGALDVRATAITEGMKLAAVRAIAELAHVEASDVVAAAYGGQAPTFGPEYIIPKPFDPRLILHVAPAVAQAAMDEGVARKPIADFEAYMHELERFVFQSGQLLRPVIEVARKAKPRIVYSEGEDERTLRAVQSVVDDGMAKPILVGDTEAVTAKIQALGLRLRPGVDVQIADLERDKALYERLISAYSKRVGRRGVPPDAASRQLRRRPTVTAAMLMEQGEADAAVCGGTGDWWKQFQYALPIVPRKSTSGRVYAMTALILQAGPLFFCDTHVNVDPTCEEIAEMTLMAAETVKHFGMTPKVALLSHSNFGASNSPSAKKMRGALNLIRAQNPELEVDGEMHADAALAEQIRQHALPDSTLRGKANLLIFPNIDSANIAYNLVKATGEAVTVGPMLMGLEKPLHIAVPSTTARGLINLSAVAAMQAALAINK